MPTKPEGPAQEPPISCTCEHPDLDCKMHPATPAPSQPMSAVRMDEMGVDDVAIDATMFRFERMDEQTFWLCAYRGNKRTTFTMWTQGGKLYCRKDDDELGTTDDRENPVTPELAPAPSQPAASTSRTEWCARYSMGLRCQKCAQPLADNNKSGFCSAHKKYQPAAKGSTAPSQPAAHTEPHGAFFQPHVIPKVKGCPDCEAMAKRVTVLGQTRPENVGLTPLMEMCDREWSDETPEQVIAIAANAIYWRNREIQKLREHSAPSQPAGAREWPRQEPCPERDGDGCAACLADVDEWFRINRPKLHDALKYAAGEMGKAFDIIVFEACTAFLAQQTAAKDAAILYECEQKVAAIEELLAATDRAEAAERERDSLRVENAALKAGKETKL